MSDRSDALVRLLRGRNDWVTATRLAAELSVTTRTVRNLVRAVNERSPGAVESSQLGYRIAGAVRRAEVPDDRVTRIFIELTRLPEGTSVYDLADRFHVSESTIERDLSALRRWLAQRGLQLTRRRETVRLTGDERLQRQALGETLRAESRRPLDVASVVAAHFPRYDVAGFAHALRGLITSRGLEVNPFGFEGALLHIAIAVDRRTRRPTGDVPPPAIATTNIDQELREALRELVRTYFGFDADDLLTAEVSVELDAHALAGGGRLIDDAQSTDAAEHLVAAFRGRILDEYGIDLDDRAYTTRLQSHVAALMRRAGRGTWNRNPMVEDIKSAYPLIYDVAVFMAMDISEHLRVDLPEDEIAFLAFHVGSALLAKESARDSVAVVLRVPEYFRDELGPARALSARFASEIELTVTGEDGPLPSGAELVLTTGDAVAQDGVPQVVISPLLGDRDAARVDAALAQVREFRRVAGLRTSLRSLFSPAMYVSATDATTPEQLIRRLGDLMVREGVFDASEVERAIEREHMSSTAFVDGLAMPHAMGLRAHRSAIAVGIVPGGMAWGGRTVRIVLLLARSPGDTTLFRSIFDRLVDALDDASIIESVSAEPTSFTQFMEGLSHVRLPRP